MEAANGFSEQQSVERPSQAERKWVQVHHIEVHVAVCIKEMGIPTPRRKVGSLRLMVMQRLCRQTESGRDEKPTKVRPWGLLCGHAH